MWIKCQDKTLINSDMFYSIEKSTFIDKKVIYYRIRGMREYGSDKYIEWFDLINYTNEDETLAKTIMEKVYSRICGGLNNKTDDYVDIPAIIQEEEQAAKIKILEEKYKEVMEVVKGATCKELEKKVDARNIDWYGAMLNYLGIMLGYPTERVNEDIAEILSYKSKEKANIENSFDNTSIC